jgi:hypothetical protein
LRRFETGVSVFIADAKAIAALTQRGVKTRDAFDMEVGGLVDESAGQPVRVRGTVVCVSEAKGHVVVAVEFGRGNVLVISAFLVQVMELTQLAPLGLDLARFDVFALKSRVHFRRGFDDSGFAKTILRVEPDEPFLGTVRLEALERTQAGVLTSPPGVASRALNRDNDLGARADVRGELVPATHRAELLGGDGVRGVQLVDRRVDPPRRPFRLTGRALRYLTGGDIASTTPHSRASQRVRQVDRVVPPIPFGFDRGVDLSGHDQQAVRELGH